MDFFDGNDMSPLVMFTRRCCELQVASVDDCVDLTIVDNFSMLRAGPQQHHR